MRYPTKSTTLSDTALYRAHLIQTISKESKTHQNEEKGQCEHCGSRMLAHDPAYDYYRCLMCGRSATPPVVGSDELREKIRRECIAEAKKNVPKEEVPKRINEAVCEKCGKTYVCNRAMKLNLCRQCKIEHNKQHYETYKNKNGIEKRRLNIKLFREKFEEYDISQRELERKCGLHPASVNKYLNMVCCPCHAHAVKIAEYFGVDVNDLVHVKRLKKREAA